jgi:hypothetical protein
MKWLKDWIKRMRKAVAPRPAFAAAAMVAMSCATLRPTPTPAEATCAGVCARGVELGCVYATPTPTGATCETVCQNATASGEPWRLSCLAQATNCEPTACP